MNRWGNRKDGGAITSRGRDNELFKKQGGNAIPLTGRGIVSRSMWSLK